MWRCDTEGYGGAFERGVMFERIGSLKVDEIGKPGVTFLFAWNLNVARRLLGWGSKLDRVGLS